MVCSQSLGTQITMLQCTIACGRTKQASEKSFVFVHQHGGYDVTCKPSIEKFLDDPTSRVFYPTIHLISESDPVRVCPLSRFVLFGEWKMLFTTRQVKFRFVRFGEWKILCSLVTMTPCKFVDSADSFYSTNGKFHLRPDK